VRKGGIPAQDSLSVTSFAEPVLVNQQQALNLKGEPAGPSSKQPTTIE
jgi:hypothetical protein